jgi:hypothetical protein
MALPYVGDIGARLTVSTLNLSFSLTTVIKILIRKPSGTLMTKTPSVINLATGELTYDTITGDLDEVGDYKVQVHGIFDDGDDLRSDRDSFRVYEKLS